MITRNGQHAIAGTLQIARQARQIVGGFRGVAIVHQIAEQQNQTRRNAFVAQACQCFLHQHRCQRRLALRHKTVVAGQRRVVQVGENKDIQRRRLHTD